MLCVDSPIYHVEKNATINENGSVSLHFMLRLPEPYSFNRAQLVDFRDKLDQAIELCLPHTYIHKSDFFLKRAFDSSSLYVHDDYISRRERDYFNGRHYIEQFTVLSFTSEMLQLFGSGALYSPFGQKKSLEDRDAVFIGDFENAVRSCTNQIKLIKGTSIEALDEDTLRGIVHDQMNGHGKPGLLNDLHFGHDLSLGGQHAAIYAFTENTQFPHGFDFMVHDETLPNNTGLVERPFFEDMGIHLDCNHVYHQVICTDDAGELSAKLEERSNLYKTHKGYSARIAQDSKQIEAFSERINKHKLRLCRAHFSLILFDAEKASFDKACEEVETRIKNKRFIVKRQRFKAAHENYNGLLLGNENRLPPSDFFLSTTLDSLSLFTYFGDFKDDYEGLIFQDMIYQRPIKRDLIDLKGVRIKARNGAIIGETGGGKSSTTLNIVLQLLQNGVNLVIPEFGQSFKSLVNLFPERSVHIPISEGTPIGRNVFNLHGRPLSNSKRNQLCHFILKLWRKNSDIGSEGGSHLNKSVRLLIGAYYEDIAQGHSFRSFYHYVVENYDQLSERLGIPDDKEYFDVRSFSHIMSDFLEGGDYANIAQENPELDEKIQRAQLVVFELSGIEDDPFLISIFYMLFGQIVEEKVLGDRSQLSGLILEEYGKTAGITQKMDDDIHASIASLYQTIRKELGFVWIIIQLPSQLPDNHHTQNIIGNTQLLMVVESKEKVYDDIIAMYKMTNPEHVNLMRSLSRDFNAVRPYNTLFLKIGEHYAVLLKQEFCPEKKYAFQTDGEDWSWLHGDFARTGDFERSIDNLITYKNET